MVGFTRRLLESTLLPILLSALFVLARKAALIPVMSFASIFCVFAILICNYLNMTDYLFAVRRDDVFYKTNFAVFGVNFLYSMILVVVDIVVNLGDTFSFLCLPYEMFAFYGVPLLFSALLVNLIFAVEILIMPYIAVKRRR